MRTVILLFFCATITFHGKSQNDSIYNFTLQDGSLFPIAIQQNDPKILPNLFFASGISLATRPLNYLDLLLPIQGSIYLPNNIFFKTKIDIPLIARFDSQYDNLVRNKNLQTTNDFFINTQIDIGGGYFFINSTNQKKIKIKFNAKSLNKKDSLIIFKMKGNVNHSFGIRSGYYFYQSIINSLYAPKINQTPYGFQNDKKSIYNAKNTPIYHTNFRSNSIYLGIDFKRAYHLLYKQGSDTIVRKSRIYNLYVDLMCTPIISIEDMNVRNFDTGKSTAYDLTPLINTRNWGVRIGGEATAPISKHSSIAVQIETGIRPGIKDINSNDNFLGNLIYTQIRMLYKLGTKLNANKNE